jgi:hypothetical protein
MTEPSSSWVHFASEGLAGPQTFNFGSRSRKDPFPDSRLSKRKERLSPFANVISTFQLPIIFEGCAADKPTPSISAHRIRINTGFRLTILPTLGWFLPTVCRGGPEIKYATLGDYDIVVSQPDRGMSGTVPSLNAEQSAGQRVAPMTSRYPELLPAPDLRGGPAGKFVSARRQNQQASSLLTYLPWRARPQIGRRTNQISHRRRLWQPEVLSISKQPRCAR